mgnify:CR=1 FL=1
MFQIRNKVAHNNHFIKPDLDSAEELYKELKDIILNAESKIDDFKFSVEEQETMIKASSLDSPKLQNDSNNDGKGVKIINLNPNNVITKANGIER